MSIPRPRIPAWFCLFLSICYLPITAHAAPVPVPAQGDQDLIRERQNRLLEDQQRRLEDLKNLPGKVAPQDSLSAPSDNRCFPITRIELKGADHLSATEREKLVQPFLGQCLAVAQLNDVLKAITNHYLERGLVTSRAYLPPQDLSSGTLVVQVVEGRLESLKGAPDSGISQRELAMTFPGRAGEVLDLRQIEQMVDQLNRLPSNQARMELSPGQAVGGSDVLVTNSQQKPWRASLGRTNDGQRSTGEQQWNTGLEWDSPLGLADELMLRAGHDAVSDSAHGSHNEMLNYNLPWGWWTFNYSYSQSAYRSQVVPPNQQIFKQKGDSQTHQLRAERVVYRDALSKTSVNVGLTRLATNNYNDQARIIGSSNTLTEASYGINHGRRVGNAFLNIDLGTQKGIGAFGAQGDLANDGPSPRYRKYTATASYLHPFQLWGERFTFSSLATGQHSKDPLFSSQRMSVGGLSSVRGFKDQYLAGDSGGYWRNEVRWTRPLDWDLLRPALTEYGMALAYDQGVISHGRGSGDQHGRLSGNAVELFARGRYLGASVTVAHSLERPGAIADRETPIYFSLNLFL